MTSFRYFHVFTAWRGAAALIGFEPDLERRKSSLFWLLLLIGCALDNDLAAEADPFDEGSGL